MQCRILTGKASDSEARDQGGPEAAVAAASMRTAVGFAVDAEVEEESGVAGREDEEKEVAAEADVDVVVSRRDHPSPNSTAPKMEAFLLPTPP